MDTQESDKDVCWICLDQLDKYGNQAQMRCKCPRKVHPSCLSRWQLQSAGRSEEKQCRFCYEELPDWREFIAPPELRPASPVMSIHYNGECHLVKVAPGPDGAAQFQREVRKLLQLGENQEFDITFECRVPGQGTKMELRGLPAYDAAVFCASMTAAERLKDAQSQPRAQPASTTPAANTPETHTSSSTLPASAAPGSISSAIPVAYPASNSSFMHAHGSNASGHYIHSSASHHGVFPHFTGSHAPTYRTSPTTSLMSWFMPSRNPFLSAASRAHHHAAPMHPSHVPESAMTQAPMGSMPVPAAGTGATAAPAVAVNHGYPGLPAVDAMHCQFP